MKRLSAALLLVATLAACNGDDDAAESTTTPAPTAPSSTTEATPSTTEPTSTSAPTTAATTPPTTAPPATTTEPPPTTIDPLEDVAAAVARDAQVGDDVLFEVLADPSAADGEDRLRQYFAGEALDIALGLLEQFRREDLVVEAHPTLARTFGPVGEPKLLENSTSPTVEVETCRFDSDIVLAFANGTDLRVPINEEITRTEAVSTFELVDGTWRLASWISTADAVGGPPCD